MNNDSSSPPYTPRIKQIDYSKNDDYLCCSIFNLLCCCFWLGIPALIFSIKAREKYRLGLLNEATSDAKLAKKFNTIGIVLGSILLVLGLVINIIYFVWIAGMITKAAEEMQKDGENLFDFKFQNRTL